MWSRAVLLAVCLTATDLAHSGRAIGADVMTPIHPGRIELRGEIGRRVDVTSRKNLMAIDVDRDFLAAFKKKDRRGGYIGIGKLIDSLVRFAAHTADPDVLARKQHVVGELIGTQEADGYIGTMRPDDRMWTLWDIHEMAYIVYGLAMDSRFFGEKASLEGARRLADHVIARWSAEPERKPGGGSITVYMAVTGFESAMLALWEETGDRRYQDACVTLRRLPEWDAPIVKGRWGPIAGHAYAYLCRCIAQLRLSRIHDDPRLLEPTRRVLHFLTRRDGLVVTGGCGDHECWHDTQEGTMNLAETCATAYLIRFMDERLRMEGDARYGDIMERAIYNALFAAQSPDGRRLRYYTPFDGPRAYYPGDHYCCPNNYRRIVAELPAMVIYLRDGGVAVNLYTASTATVEMKDGVSVGLRQETDYPSSGDVKIHVSPSRPARFPLFLRIPGWCDGAEVTVNGEPAGGAAAGGSFLRLERSWREGDRVDVHMPMPWRLVKGRKAQAGRVAILRGPVLFCLNRARHEALAKVDLRLITMDPATLEGPIPDDTVRPGGMACRVKAWGPGRWYPMAERDLTLLLTEFPDPGGEAAYLKVPDPNAGSFVDDELVERE